jgi:hypothetical protein
MAVLLRKMREAQEEALQDHYVTQVFKCDKDMFVRSYDPYYNREYPNAEEATTGHEQAVDLLARGKLPLKRERREW